MHIDLSSLNSCLPPLLRLPRLCFPKRKPFAVAAMSNDPISDWILSEGNASQITRTSPFGGGCINNARRYGTDGGSFFVKTNRGNGPSMFEGETLGLGAMYETRTILVPRPFKVGPLPTGGSYIITEFIEFGACIGSQCVLGRKLAEMHKAGMTEKGFGFDVDNTIGRCNYSGNCLSSLSSILLCKWTPQLNTWKSDWTEFYGKLRLGYQLKLALDQYGDSIIYQKGQRLVKNMAPLFGNFVIEPCLLHGDLWSGNISSDNNGEPNGHNEAEFGKAWCAGFGGSFYNVYFEIRLGPKCTSMSMPRPKAIVAIAWHNHAIQAVLYGSPRRKLHQLRFETKNCLEAVLAFSNIQWDVHRHARLYHDNLMQDLMIFLCLFCLLGDAPTTRL